MNSAVFYRRCIFLCLICVIGLSSLSVRLINLHVRGAEEYREEQDRKKMSPKVGEMVVIKDRGVFRVLKIDYETHPITGKNVPVRYMGKNKKSGEEIEFIADNVDRRIVKILPAERGMIFDRKSELIVRDDPRRDVWLNRYELDSKLTSIGKKRANIELKKFDEVIKKERQDPKSHIQKITSGLIRKTLLALGWIEKSNEEVALEVALEAARTAVFESYSRYYRKSAKKELEGRLANILAPYVRKSAPFNPERQEPDPAKNPRGYLLHRMQTKSYERPLHVEVRVEHMRGLVEKLKKLKITCQEDHLNRKEIDQETGIISFRGQWKRYYRMPTMAAHVIGFISKNRDGIREGKAGVELSMNTWLSGEDGEAGWTRKGDEVKWYTKPAKCGQDIHLTLDMEIQKIVEEELDYWLSKFSAQKGTIILKNPKNGDIWAMASRTTYNLDTREKYAENGFDYARQAVYEPGSTFKIIPVAAALDQDLIALDTFFDCRGPCKVRGQSVKDWKDFGDLTVTEILANSSNVGVAKIGDKMDSHVFKDYIERFDIAAKGIHKANNFISMTRGYSVSTTPLQIASVYLAIANGGRLLTPRLLLKKNQPIEGSQVIRLETAKKLSEALTAVVDEGTGKRAKVEGFSVAGKTGTAWIHHEKCTKPNCIFPECIKADKCSLCEKTPRKKHCKGGYYDGGNGREVRYNSSFAGIMPADNPAFVCLVVVENPRIGPKNKAGGGGSVAAPIFASVATRVAKQMGLRPSTLAANE